MGFAMCHNEAVWIGAAGGYKTSNPADFTDAGPRMVLHPQWGIATLAQPASIY